MVEAKLKPNNFFRSRTTPSTSSNTKNQMERVKLKINSCCCCGDESFGLFDYHRQYTHTDFDDFTMQKSGYIKVNDNIVSASPIHDLFKNIQNQEQLQELDKDLLASVVFHQNTAWFYQKQTLENMQVGGETKRTNDFFITEQLRDLAELAYVVVADQYLPKRKIVNPGRDLKKIERGIELEQGDIVKFGRVPYLIKQIFYHEETNKSDPYQKDDQELDTSNEENEENHANLKSVKQPQQIGDTSADWRNETVADLEGAIVFKDANQQQPHQPTTILNEQQQPATAQTPRSTNSNPNVCRICLDHSETSTDPLTGKVSYDPLLSPCQCQGSTGLIHLNCLRQWLNQRLEISYSDCSVNHIWRIKKCELCNTVFPDQVEHNSKFYEVFEIKRPVSKKQDYLVMEVLGLACGKNIQVVNLTEGVPIGIGRDQGQPIVVQDQSVGKQHAILFMQKYMENNTGQIQQRICLHDLHSRFGCLKQLREPIMIRDKLSVQIKKFYITLQLDKPDKNCFSQLKQVLGCANLKQKSQEYGQYKNNCTKELKWFPKEMKTAILQIPENQNFYEQQQSLESVTNLQVGAFSGVLSETHEQFENFHQQSESNISTLAQTKNNLAGFPTNQYVYKNGWISKIVTQKQQKPANKESPIQQSSFIDIGQQDLQPVPVQLQLHDQQQQAIDLPEQQISQ